MIITKYHRGILSDVDSEIVHILYKTEINVVSTHSFVFFFSFLFFLSFQHSVIFDHYFSRLLWVFCLVSAIFNLYSGCLLPAQDLLLLY